MLESSNSVMVEEREASKLKVPCPNFIPQGVSSRRDGVYTWYTNLIIESITGTAGKR